MDVIKGFIGTVVTLAVIVGLWALVDPLAGNRFYNAFITFGMDGVLLVGILISVVIAFAGTEAKNILALGLGVLLSLGGVVTTGYYWWSENWRTHNAYVAQAVVSTDAPLEGEFDMRSPYNMATETASNNMDGLNGEERNTKFLPQDNTYSTFVERKQKYMGFYDPGYEAIVVQKYDEQGTRDGSDRCLFSESASEALDAPLWNSLEREVAGMGRTLTVEEDDAWGYCDGDTPKVVMPLVKWTGFWTPTKAPAGVAIYNGSNGTVVHHTEIEPGELPGPSVGASYSDRINTALEVYGVDSITDYKAERGGLADEIKSDSDVNADNPTNFSLNHQDFGSTFVTPFTDRVRGENTVALGVMNTDGTGEGSGKTTVYKMDPAMESNGSLANRIRDRFSDLPWHSGLQIQEFIPKSDGVWVATLGYDTIFSYRVTITQGEGVDKYTLEITAVEDELDSASDAEAPADGDGGESVSVNVDLNNMSDAELQKLITDAVQEIASR